jgi:hypothetical protein
MYSLVDVPLYMPLYMYSLVDVPLYMYSLVDVPL